MNTDALNNITYGLYLLSANHDNKDNACIINTVMHVSNNPVKVAVSVSKDNLTHDLILNSKKFNVSVITEEADFSLFERFGFQSGRNAEKFEGFPDVKRSENGLLYLTKYTNAFLSFEVKDSYELNTHTIFIAELKDCEILSDSKPCTYAYYHSSVKPKPQADSKKGFICKICGYVYEGETLPPDYICPLCKHGAEDFEPLE